MCRNFTAGGVIGYSGTTIRLLEQQTTTRIHVDKPLPDSFDRLISITGSLTVSRTITFNSGDEVEMKWDVSAAQEGLIRVLERIFEVEDKKEGDKCCRLVAVNSLIGVIFENVIRIRNETGATIRVLPQAGSVEGLIHITGGLLAVKKAVLIISGCLQDISPFRNPTTNLGKPLNTAPCGDFTDPHAKKSPDLNPLLLNLPEDSIDRETLSVNDTHISNTDNIDAQREIVFRLLLSIKGAGGVIGKGGSVITILQNETGASIKVADLVVGCNDRLVILSAFEKPDTSNSPAEKAVFLVFARSIEAEIENRINMGETLTARLLIASNQVNCLTEEGGTFIKELKEVSKAEIQFSRGQHHPSYGSETDELVQITGQYQDVQIALLHITSRLRYYCFPNKVLKGVIDQSYVSAIPDINPNFGFSIKSHLSKITGGGFLAVKKALLIISGYLQDYSPFRNAPTNLGNPFNTAPCGDFTDPHAKKSPDLNPLLLNLPEDSIGGGALSVNDSQISNTDNIVAQRKVVFRLLLSIKVTGGVIGKGGSIIRILQNETGASIKVADRVVGCNDRLFILSAFEKPDTSDSSAQKAVVRVFARSIEAGIENRIYMNRINMGETLTARLLIASNQVNCLTEEGGTFIKGLKEVSKAEIQLSRGQHHPSYGSEADELVQITGQYRDVQIALLHITGRLRDYYFPNKVLKGVKDQSYVSAIPDINPNFGFSIKSHLSKAPVRRHKTTADSRVTADRGNPQPWSTNISPPVDTVKEVVLPEKSLASLDGEDGRNLKLIKEISGAKVMVDTSTSKSDGKVIISGTPDQIQKAQSVLQAIIVTG